MRQSMNFNAGALKQHVVGNQISPQHELFVIKLMLNVYMQAHTCYLIACRRPNPTGRWICDAMVEDKRQAWIKAPKRQLQRLRNSKWDHEYRQKWIKYKSYAYAVQILAWRCAHYFLRLIFSRKCRWQTPCFLCKPSAVPSRIHWRTISALTLTMASCTTLSCKPLCNCRLHCCSSCSLTTRAIPHPSRGLPLQAPPPASTSLSLSDHLLQILWAPRRGRVLP